MYWFIFSYVYVLFYIFTWDSGSYEPMFQIYWTNLGSHEERSKAHLVQQGSMRLGCKILRSWIPVHLFVSKYLINFRFLSFKIITTKPINKGIGTDLVAPIYRKMNGFVKQSTVVDVSLFFNLWIFCKFFFPVENFRLLSSSTFLLANLDLKKSMSGQEKD